jgi:hypothetical protein
VFSLSQLSFAKGLKAGGGADGGEGTIYTLNRVTDDGDGDLYVGGSFFDIPAGADFARNSVTISPGTTLTCPYDMTTLTVSSTQWLTLDGVTVDCAANITNATIASNVGISTTSTSMTFSHTTSVSFIAPAWSNVSTTIVVTKPGSTTLLDVPTDLTVRDFTYTGGSAGTTLADGGRLFIPDMMTFTMVSSTITANVSSTFATLSIDAHSTLQATGTGCPGSGGAENGYGPNGEGVCGQSLAGAGFGAGGSGAGGGGASYGGLGGAGTGSGLGGSTLYGSSLLPDSLGSGGGGGYYYGTGPGGAGGGRMVLRVLGTFVLDGAVRADGATAPPPGAGYSGGGGGSGGSVLVVAGTMTGTGAISANGGNGSHGGGNESGGGGGGRIALFYGALGTFAPTHLSAVKGVTGGAATDGEPGTAYALDRLVDDGAGTMSIASGFDFPAGGDYARDTIVFGSGAHLSCSDGTDLTVSSTARLAFDGVTWTCSSSLTNLTIASDVGLSTTSTTFDFSGVSHVSVIAPDWTNVTTTMSVTNAGASTTWDVVAPLAFQDFTYMGARAGRGVDMLGGDLYIPHENSIAMVSSTIWSNVSSTLASLSIDALSSWTALGRGCEAGTNYDQNGYGPDLVTGGCTQSVAGFGNPARGCCGGAGGGAAYGGAGGGGSFSGPQTTTYGSETNPDYFGSGGGGGWGVPGGVGGGRIRLTITGSLLLDGSVRADGADAPLPGTFYGGGGGGSGGTVNLYAATISGSGSVTANGGSGYPTQSTGGGGGGRVLYTVSLFTFGGTSSTTGGFGGLESGSEGTVHLTLLNQPPSINPASLGQAVLVNGSTTGTNNPVFTLWYLLALADKIGVDLETAFERKLKINQDKYPISKAKGNNKKYTDY